jgi:hypothetical protein
MLIRLSLFRWAGLIFILAVSAIKEAYEDFVCDCLFLARLHSLPVHVLATHKI